METFATRDKDVFVSQSLECCTSPAQLHRILNLIIWVEDTSLKHFALLSIDHCAMSSISKLICKVLKGTSMTDLLIQEINHMTYRFGY